MLGLAILLLVLWILGAFVFEVVGGLIHILLVIAVVVIVIRLLKGKRPIP